MRKIYPLLLAFLLVACSSQFDPRDSYYQGILDYCEHVAIVSAITGEVITRTPEYCENLVKDYRSRKFYEKYHPSY